MMNHILASGAVILNDQGHCIKVMAFPSGGFEIINSGNKLHQGFGGILRPIEGPGPVK